MPKLGRAVSEITYSRPHFASHTQSSLMKRRTPLKNKPLSSTMDTNESKKSQRNVTLKLNGIQKRRSNVTKQSRSMQMLIMILKQQQDRRSTVFLSDGSKQTETIRLLENSLVSLPSDLIKDVSRDLKKCTGSPTKLPTLRGEQTKVVGESEKRAEDSHDSFQDGTYDAGRDNSEDARNCSEDCTIIGVACKLELQNSSDGEGPADSRREAAVLRRGTESVEKSDDFPNRNCSETQVHPQGANAATSRRRTWRAWQKNRKVWNRSEHVDNSQNNWPVNERPVNADAIMRKRETIQKNYAFNQRAWRPPGISKTSATESAMSLQPVSQKSSQSAKKSTASTKSKHSSTEHIDKPASASIPANQTKMLMKENKDPRANRMTKICEHLAETKQRQRLQGGGTLPKKKRSRTKIPKISDKCDDTLIPESKSRHSQTQPIMVKETSNIEQHCTENTLIYNKRTRTLEMIHTLKEIIDSVRTEDENVQESVVKNDNYEKNDEIQMSPNRDTSRSNDNFMEEINLDRADQSSRRSVSTQTELDALSYRKIDEKDQDLTKILKLTQTVATQTSPSCNRNVLEIGCNTSNVVYNDVEVSCDLIGCTNLKTEVPSENTELATEKSMSDVHSSVKHIGIDVGSGDANENEELSLGECKETLNTEMSLKLDNCDSVEIPAKMTNDASGEAEKTMREETCQIALKSLKNLDDKRNTDIDELQESTKFSDNHDANSTLVNNLFLKRSRLSICDYDASSEEVAERLENDEVASELKVKDIPSDVIAAFELAAERARNLHEAIIIYRENLMSGESEKQNEETIEDYETSKHRDQHCLEKSASSINRKNKDNIRNEKIKSEYEAMCNWLRSAYSDKDYAGLSTCSFSSSSDRTSESEYQRLLKDFEVNQEEKNAVLSRGEQAITRLNLNERSELEDMRSMQLMHRSQEEYALELLESERNDESFESIENKMLALPATIKKTSLMSRENLLALICCVVCTAVFWCLQFSFRCDLTK